MTAMLDHRACIEALTRQTGQDMPPDRLLRLFEGAFNAIWRRAQATLGDVTLTAIVNRVLYNATEQYPALSVLKVTGDGIDCSEIDRALDGLAPQPLADGLRYVLVELLTVIGNLTAEILTPALHEAVSAVTEADGCQAPEGAIVRERTDDT